MRFEVKGGGIAAILLAMTLLSGAVFVLGLLAGYDVGRQAQIDTAQLAISYPLQPPASPGSPNQSPPEVDNPSVQSASISKSPVAEKTPSPRVAAAVNNLGGQSNGSTRTRPQPSASPAQKRFAAASIPPTMPSGATHSQVAGDGTTESGNPEAVDEQPEATGDVNADARRTAEPVRHKPYNIQIEAAMDISGADQMMARLRRLGYSSHLVPTEIGGQRWYKVEVGPYTTAQEASAAEAKLRQKYDATYGGIARGNSAAQSSANEDSEE
jgi:septal ring-binding cell division protein DamX